MIDENENPDFMECAGCGGEFYHGALDENEWCADCVETFESEL